MKRTEQLKDIAQRLGQLANEAYNSDEDYWFGRLDGLAEELDHLIRDEWEHQKHGGGSSEKCETPSSASE